MKLLIPDYKNSYIQLIDALNVANSPEDFREILMQICLEFDFDFYFFGMLVPTSLSEPDVLIISNYSDIWLERYRKNNYIAIDPVIQHCTLKSEPFLWEDIIHLEKNDKRIRQFMDEARTFGLKSGVSCSVNSPTGTKSIFSLASSNNNKENLKKIRECSPFVFSLSHYIHEAVSRNAEICSQLKSLRNLTKREKECLMWASEGKTSWETASILGISQETVTFHLRNAMVKLHCKTKNHAVARAISLGAFAKEILHASKFQK